MVPTRAAAKTSPLAGCPDGTFTMFASVTATSRAPTFWKSGLLEMHSIRMGPASSTSYTTS